MVLSYYLIRPFYTAAWYVFKLFRKEKRAVFYCDDVFDVDLFANVQKYLKPLPLVAKNKTVAQKLKDRGVRDVRVLPVFPDAVIMMRNMAWKFPCPDIIRIGFEHGAYNFKRFSKAQYYNLFTVFFMTSSHDVKRVQKLGVKTAEAVGFPKIDGIVSGERNVPLDIPDMFRDSRKKTVLFSATWDGSGMSAVHQWYDRLEQLTARYNVWVTLHPWVSETYRDTIKNCSSVYFIDEYDVLPYIAAADVCIGDTNSLIAEFCLLDKPVITFRVPPTPRTLDDVTALIDEVSIRIDAFNELPGAIASALDTSSDFSRKRREATERFFDRPDGNAGERAANRIMELVPSLAL